MDKKIYLTPSVVMYECKLKTYIQDVSATGDHGGPDEENGPNLSNQRNFFEAEGASGFGSNSLWDDLK